jgi:uncharacterized membrane protein YfcA
MTMERALQRRCNARFRIAQRAARRGGPPRTMHGDGTVDRHTAAIPAPRGARMSGTLAALLPAGWTPGTALLSLAAIFAAGVLRGLTGFGFSAFAVGSMTLGLPPSQVVPLILLLEVVASVRMLPAVWRDIHWNWMQWLVIGNFLGAPLGVALLAWVDADVAKLAIALTVLFFGVLLLRNWRPPWHDGRVARLGAGVVSGVFNGLAALGGLSAMVVLLATSVAVATARATLVGLFFVIDIYALALAALHGLVDRALLVAAVLSLVPMLVGIDLGTRWFLRTDAARFRRYVIGLLIALATLGLAAAAWRLAS